MMDALETKAGLGRDIDELMQAFEAFKDTNDAASPKLSGVARQMP